MKKTTLDKLDRVVIPKYICKELKLEPGSPVTFDVKNGTILITPEADVCAICGEKIDRNFGIRLCVQCLKFANASFNGKNI